MVKGAQNPSAGLGMFGLSRFTDGEAEAQTILQTFPEMSSPTFRSQAGHWGHCSGPEIFLPRSMVCAPPQKGGAQIEQLFPTDGACIVLNLEF